MNDIYNLGKKKLGILIYKRISFCKLSKTNLHKISNILYVEPFVKLVQLSADEFYLYFSHNLYNKTIIKI